MDQLTYQYTARTNRLESVADAVVTDLDWDAKPTAFEYNRMGSMVSSTETLSAVIYRESQVERYDERQLPEEMRITLLATPGGPMEATQVSYRYDVNGQRIRKHVRPAPIIGGDPRSGPDVWERYVRDGMRLVGVFDENNTLKSWNLGGAAGLVGRADADPMIFPPEHRYYVTDHLGSIRVVVNHSGTVIEGRDYYPYGLTMPGRFYVLSDTTREGYTGHELDKETGDYYAGARFYGPALARWFVPDPMAEMYPGFSPFNYTLGNPLSFVDPDGMETTDASMDDFFPEGMFVYGIGPHPGGRTPVVRVWEEQSQSSSGGKGAAINTGQGDPPGLLKKIVRFLYDFEEPLFGSHVAEAATWLPGGKVVKYGIKGGRALLRGVRHADDVVDAATPVGRRGAHLEIPRGTNAPATIGGREFTGHALDQMQSRGFTPSVVENAIQHGARLPGNDPGTFQYTFEGIRVITNEAGRVITVIPR